MFDKLLEKIMCKRLNNFLKKYNILADIQYGFRKGHSTILALTEIVDKIKSNIDNGDHTIGVYLDLSKAFDTVNHEQLLYKLAHYGIRGKANDWIRSYLTNRKQVCYVNGKYSSSLPIDVGVPQGSVLGPVLFLIYVNDILNLSDHQNDIDVDTNLRLFADDTNLFVSGKDISKVNLKANELCHGLYSWFVGNELTVNIDKTCYSVFSNKLKNYKAKILMGDKEINQVHSTKYLGVQLDEKLNGKDHVQLIVSKLLKLCSVFHTLSQFINLIHARQIYYAYIYPVIKYGIEIYGVCSKTNISKIQSLQNKLLKILCRKDQYYSPLEIHKELNILLVEDVLTLSLGTFTYCQLHKMLPNTFDAYFITNERAARKTNYLILPKCKLSIGQKTVRFMGAKTWNNLTESTRNSKTMNIFKKNCRKELQK